MPCRPDLFVRIGLPCIVALLAAVACRPAAGQQRPADLVLLHGDVFTVDPQRPRAQAVAVRGDRIVAVGSDAEIQKLAGAGTKEIDLRGRLAIPGFIEGHGHYTALGESKLILDLTKAKTWDDIVAQVADAAQKTTPGRLIEGRGWHQEKWEPIEPGGPRARQRSCGVRQRPGAEACRGDPGDARSSGRRDREGRQRGAHRAAQGDGAGTGARGHRESAPESSGGR
ncbi:MAG: hypothetical protein E6I96_12910 [Chloroflexi bacterium]|nr:MAG: hypothetical protein E6I96_12910 [Chloroflexota bacterium]